MVRDIAPDPHRIDAPLAMHRLARRKFTLVILAVHHTGISELSKGATTVRAFCMVPCLTESRHEDPHQDRDYRYNYQQFNERKAFFVHWYYSQTTYSPTGPFHLQKIDSDRIETLSESKCFHRYDRLFRWSHKDQGLLD
jgi:hypothetical protein